MKPEELEHQLDTKELRETLIQRAVLLLEGAAKEEAPWKTGHLRRSITSRATRDRGVIGTNVSYALPVHEGSRAHVILPRVRKALAWPGVAHPMRSVAHPGTKGNPFFERAIENNRGKLDEMAAAAGEAFFSQVDT